MLAGTMLPLERQQALIAQYSVIEDVQERMVLLLDRARKRAPLAEAQRTEATRVQGCTSRVWLLPSLEDGRCRFQMDAESSLVRGLASVLCEIYDGADPREVEAVETDVLETLRIAENLSPTRRHGPGRSAKRIA